LLDFPPWRPWHSGGKRHCSNEQEFQEPCDMSPPIFMWGVHPNGHGDQGVSAWHSLFKA
jgi:hypothetical protein